MITKLPIYIGLRYAGVQQVKGFSAVISYVAMFAMALGVLSLLTVLSVMNGFRGEFRDRLLEAVPHLAVQSSVASLESDKQLVASVPTTISYAPYIEGAVMLEYRGYNSGAVLVGVDLEQERAVATDNMMSALAPIADQRFGVVLGDGVARMLGVRVGDNVQLLLPRLTVTPAGIFPRTKRVPVVGLFSVGAQIDATHIYMNFSSAQKLLGAAIEPKIRVNVDDVEKVSLIADAYRDRNLSEVVSWRDQYRELFDAMAMEKLVVGVMLTAIILVAAFNITSLLAMSVAQKRGSIAVMRMMGTSSWSIQQIFLTQGIMVGVIGIILGLVIGVPLSLYIGDLVALIERLVGAELFSADLYYVSQLPSVLQLGDLIVVVVFSFIVSVLAAWIPSMRAAKIAPAEALRYE